jgi:predicted DNA-binding protein (UPF0251 family)/predicted Fe-Mo cluster-binding NifX family protein
MPRPFKSRSILEKPRTCKFSPENSNDPGTIILSLDEYEVIRNCDFERLSQENCATAMNISRTTVQRIYASARIKIAEAIVLGKVLEIDGGPVNLSEQNPFDKTFLTNERGEKNMIIAIGLDGLNVAGHFGQCNDFRLVEVVENKVVSQEDIHDDVHVHQERPQFLKDKEVDVLIMNTMGKGAYNRLLALDIQCVFAENKSIEDALRAYLNKDLTTPLVGHECAGCGSHEHGHEHQHEGHNHG